LVVVRLNSGDDVLQAIRRAVEENGITTGAILSGVGSVSRYHVHVVESTNLPPGDVFFGEEGPYDILSITGLVIDGRVHAHVTLSNTETALGGHLEEGCQVLTFGVVMIAEMPDVSLTDWDKMGQL
jgi:predicted DNA-binding protein with PD1-like motif